MSRNRLLFAVAALVVTWAVNAQFFNFNFGHGNSGPADLKGSVRLEPSGAVVGIPCSLVFSFATEKTIQIQNISGLPNEGIEFLADTVEPHADNTYRLPVRFLEPCTNVLQLTVEGMQTVERGSGSFRMTSSSSFRKRLPPVRIEVRSLPDHGRPQNFSGAVGTKFTMTQRLEPDHVHPGDLVTATYELKFDGYCPSNTWPTIEHLSKDFRAYEPKEVSRTPNSFKWTQILVPRTTAATNSPLVSLNYYNSRMRRYEVARADPKKIVFVSDKAASTENTSVVVTSSELASNAASSPATTTRSVLELRFGPSDTSPVIATLPADTSVKELARSNGWRRLETPRAIGWSR